MSISCGLVRRCSVEAVVLELDEEVVAAEDVLEAGGAARSASLLVARQQGLEHHAAEAAGGGDEPVVVALEQLPVDAGLVVVALEVGGRRELHEVAVALGRLGQQRQVVVELLPALDVAAGVVDRPRRTGRSWRDSPAM